MSRRYLLDHAETGTELTASATATKAVGKGMGHWRSEGKQE
jgi:hypothetical protein